MLRLIAARLIGDVVGTIARPFIRAGLALVVAYALWALPGVLWRSYVNPHASTRLLSTVNWVATALLIGLLIAARAFRRHLVLRRVRPRSSRKGSDKRPSRSSETTHFRRFGRPGRAPHG